MAVRPIYKAGEQKTDPELSNYITEIETLSRNPNPPNPKDLKQVSNNELLQIISTGINNIVLELKTRLGNNFDDTNINAFAIKNILDELKNTIDNEKVQIGKDDVTGADSLEARQINVGPDGTHSVNIIDPRADDYYRSDLYGNAQITSNNIDADQTFKNLDSFHADVLTVDENKRQRIDAWRPFLEDENIDANIKNRLMNCENLEFLYLKKHEEIMKIFAFTINLFDKYKYAIKVILFLLKNLVDKDKDTDKQTVKLPLPIIKNIKKLVDDQAKVQGIINQMDSSINRVSPIINPSGSPIDPLMDENIDKELELTRRRAP